MDKITLSLQCPHCRNCIQQQFARSDLEHEISCSACGHRAQAEKFIDADSRRRIMEGAERDLVNAFKNIPGFKPTR